MGSVNKVILVGNLGRDADFTTTAGGVTIARFSVATSTRAKNSQSGTWEDRTEWHRVCSSAARPRPSRLPQEGTLVGVDGRLQTRSWRTRTGTSARRPRSWPTASSSSGAGRPASAKGSRRLRAGPEAAPRQAVAATTTSRSRPRPGVRPDPCAKGPRRIPAPPAHTARRAPGPRPPRQRTRRSRSRAARPAAAGP